MPRAGGGAQPSLLRAIVAAYGRPYFWLGVLKLAGDALNFAGPLLLNLLLRHLAAAAAQQPNRRNPSIGSGSSGSRGSGGPSGSTLSLLGWHTDVAAPAFGYACAAALAGSLVLRVSDAVLCHQLWLSSPCPCVLGLSHCLMDSLPRCRRSWAPTLATASP